VKARQIQFHRKRNLQYYDLSARSNFNFEKPFLWLARRLCNNTKLEFVAEFAKPPQMKIAPEDIQRINEEAAAAANVPIDDEEDDDL